MTHPRPKDWILAIAPYVPGRATIEGGRPVTKLSSNENPLGTSEAATAAYAAHAGDLFRYPDAGAIRLREAIAESYGIEADRIVHGTGSDEVLNLVAGAYAGPGDEVIHVRYGFSVYEIATRRVGATVVVAPDRDHATDVDAILGCVTDATRLVYVANPNNPTGTYLPRAELLRLHAALPQQVMLVVDQAYAEYLGPDEDDGALELARHAPNVIVTRTFSKIHGLAAERIGWGYGPKPAIEAMHRIRAPFCCTTAGQEAAVAALGAIDFVAQTRMHNDRWLAWFGGEMASMGNKGLRCIPSRANFQLVLFEGEMTAEVAYNRLMERGIIVRWLPGQGLADGLRITIGTEDETRAVAAALREIVGG